MNWVQLHALATPEERLEIAIQIHQTIEARQNKLILVPPPLSIDALSMGRGRGWGIIRNRRGAFRGAHFLHDKRGPRLRPLILHAFLLVLCTVSIASWLIAVHAPPAVGAPILASNLAMLTVILLVKPYKPRQVLSKAN